MLAAVTENCKLLFTSNTNLSYSRCNSGQLVEITRWILPLLLFVLVINLWCWLDTPEYICLHCSNGFNKITVAVTVAAKHKMNLLSCNFWAWLQSCREQRHRIGVSKTISFSTKIRFLEFLMHFKLATILHLRSQRIVRQDIWKRILLLQYYFMF